MKKNCSVTTRTLAVLGMLTAVTALLSIFGTFRIGTIIKIPTKFVSVFVTGALFGPLWGALVAGIGDMLNCLLAPVGPWLPFLTLLEALSGAVYGILFYKRGESKGSYAWRTALCVILQFLIDIILTTLVLVEAGYFATFMIAIPIRLPAAIVKSLLQGVVLSAGYIYLPKFKKMLD